MCVCDDGMCMKVHMCGWGSVMGVRGYGSVMGVRVCGSV